MKFTIIMGVAMAMLISCGKKTSSKKTPDLGDDDGDQIYNFMESSEFDKYVSNFEQVSAKSATISMRLKTKTGDIKVLETSMEIGKNVRDELNKYAYQNFEAPFIHINSEYFSEFTTAKILPLTKTVNKNELVSTIGHIEINFDNTSMNNDFVGIYKKADGVFTEIASGKVLGSTLIIEEAPLELLTEGLSNQNEVFIINNSQMNGKSKFFSENLDEALKKKTYRFIVSTPTQTNIYYVSNQLTIAQFLNMSGINLSEYRYRETKEYVSLYEEIHELNSEKVLIPMNFLSNFLETKAQPGLTYALYAGKIQDIKVDYLKSLKQVAGNRQRQNYGSVEFEVKKSSKKELILDLDMQQLIYPIIQVHVGFKNRYTSGQINYCGTNALVFDKAKNTNANINPISEIGLSFTLDGKNVIPSRDFNIQKDGKILRRFIFKQIGEKLTANFKAVETKEVGYENHCSGEPTNSSYRGYGLKSPAYNEVSFSVSYQAYIE